MQRAFVHKGEECMQRADGAMKNNHGGMPTPGQVASSQMQHVVANGLPSLYRSAYRLLGNQADAEDAVQNALLAAHKHLDQFRGDAKMSTWLMTIVINCARMQLRKRLRHIHVSLDSRIGEEQESPLSDILVDGRPNPEDECHLFKLNARLMRSAAQLSPILRKTFQLRFVHHLSLRETARVLGVPIGTVKAQTARARAKLMKAVRGVRRRSSAQRKYCSPSRTRQNDSALLAIKPAAIACTPFSRLPGLNITTASAGSRA
jgi:RNA polymerase sigma-70 factor, ECF subfamily